MAQVFQTVIFGIVFSQNFDLSKTTFDQRSEGLA